MIQFTDHANRKIAQRKLKKSWIEQTLRRPDHIVPSYANREVAYKKIRKLYLAVIFVREGETMVVLTAHWEKRFRQRKEA